MKTTAIVAVVGCVMLAGSAMADDASGKGDDAKTVKVQTTCPVMGGKINKSVYVDVEGKRIYLCCKGCEGAIKKEPAKYIKKLESEGITLEATPVEKDSAKDAAGKEK